MAKGSVPRNRRAKAPGLPLELDEKEWREQAIRLNEPVKRLWEPGVLEEVRRTYLQDDHEQLKRLLLTPGVPWRQVYRDAVITWAGLAGTYDALGPEPETRLVPQADMAQQALRNALVDIVLDSAGLLGSDRAHNSHYRILVAHLFLWFEPIHDVYRHPAVEVAFPWPMAVDARYSSYLYREPDATQKQRRWMDKVEAALQFEHRKAEPMAYGALAARDGAAKPSTDASPGPKGMTPQRRCVAEVAEGIYRRHPKWSLEKIRTDPDFEQAQRDNGTGINTDSGLHALLSQLYAERGEKWAKRPRRR